MWQFYQKRNPSNAQPFSSPNNIAVIIPTLNEATHLQSCLESVQGQSAVSEIIVADGGSDDDTCRIAIELGVQVVRTARGRGLQVAEGVEKSTADVCLIVHADCRLSNGTPAEVIRGLKERPGTPGGAIGMCFDIDRPKMRILALFNNWRARLTGLSFGDQGQFVRREALPMIGGYPAIPIMEDVELAIRMRSMGPLLYLKKGITVSGRRWIRTGFNINVMLVLRLLLKYLFDRRWRREEIDYEQYYRVYYGGVSEKWENILDSASDKNQSG